MTVSVKEIKDALPKAEVYEMDPDAKYLIVVHRKETMRIMETIHRLSLMGIKSMVLVVDNPREAVRILELK
jgi:nitrate reductase NapAB chaperone NapD